MTKHAAKQFDRELTMLFRRRTAWLRSRVHDRKPGPPPKFTKDKRDEAIANMQDFASRCVALALARKEFSRLVQTKRSWRVTSRKGHGWKKKKTAFGGWFSTNIRYRNCIYVFWGSKRNCLYVGHTKHGRGRPMGHFNKIWFPKAKRIDVYGVRLASHLSKLECLAIHRWDPSENAARPPSQKWSKKCPVCELNAEIRGELKRIFPLRI